MSRPRSAAADPAWRWTLFAVISTYAMLWAIYVTRIAPNFAYIGFTGHGGLSFTSLAAVAVVVGASVFMPRTLQFPSDWILWLLFVVVLLPSSLIPYLARDDVALAYLAFLAIAAGSASFSAVFLRGWRRRAVRKAVRVPVGRYLTSLHMLLLVASCIALPGIWAAFGFSLEVLGLIDPYEMRLRFREVEAVRTGGMVAYALRWQGHVVGPALVWTSLSRRSWGGLSVALLGQYTIYAVSGIRQVAVGTALVLGYWLYTRLRREHAVTFATPLFALCGVMALAWVTDLLTDTVTSTSLAVRRLLATPGLLSWHYIDYFSGRPKLNYADSFLSAWVESPYGDRVPFLIGRLMYGESTVSANANIWADGFANLGFAGVVLASVGCFAVAGSIDLLAYKSRATGVAVAMVLTPAISLANTALGSAMLTHGLLVAVLLSWVAVGVSGGKANVSRGSPALGPVAGRQKGWGPQSWG